MNNLAQGCCPVYPGVMFVDAAMLHDLERYWSTPWPVVFASLAWRIEAGLIVQDFFIRDSCETA